MVSPWRWLPRPQVRLPGAAARTRSPLDGWQNIPEKPTPTLTHVLQSGVQELGAAGTGKRGQGDPGEVNSFRLEVRPSRSPTPTRAFHLLSRSRGARDQQGAPRPDRVRTRCPGPEEARNLDSCLKRYGIRAAWTQGLRHARSRCPWACSPWGGSERNAETALPTPISLLLRSWPAPRPDRSMAFITRLQTRRINQSGVPDLPWTGVSQREVRGSGGFLVSSR